MLFNSFHFLIFFPIVFLVYFAMPKNYRWYVLLASSLYFYMVWKPAYIILIIITSLVAYFSARLIDTERYRKNKKLILILSLIINFGILFLFKYYNFFNITLSSFLPVDLLLPRLNLLLPMGISFYTFQTASYCIDVYRGTTPSEKNYAYLLLYVTFFPQLVAGPIERSDRLLPQLKNPKPFEYYRITEGIRYMALGMFKKVVIADNLAVCVDTVYNDVAGSNGFQLLVALFLFSIQLYCDFAGYSDIALGAAKIFGIDLMQNFKRPYFSKSIREFWTRWHISLSEWFKDYVYIPLGGSRRGKVRCYLNYFIIFTLSGLWHGADMSFVVWGFLQGLCIVFEMITFNLGEKIYSFLHIGQKLKNAIKIIATYLFFTFTCVFFRSSSVQDATVAIRKIWWNRADYLNSSYIVESLTDMNLDTFNIIFFSILLVSLFIISFLSRRESITLIVARQKAPLRWAIYILTALVLFVFRFSGEQNFIYFQF